MPPHVAVLGAGVAGLSAARACLSQGLLVTVFDARPAVGGIWHHGSPTPVFDSLSTNTACFETAFAHRPPARVHHDPGLGESSLCLAHAELQEYLLRDVEDTPGLRDALHLSTRVLEARANGEDGYELKFVDAAQDSAKEPPVQTMVVDYLIVASGIHQTPFKAQLPGLNAFPGPVLHAAQYKNPAQLRGKRVLVVGGSISGCEIAGDLASDADAHIRVTMSTRSIRHILGKQRGDVVGLSVLNNRFFWLQQLAGRVWDADFSVDFRNFIHDVTTNQAVRAPPPQGDVHIPHLANWTVANPKLLRASEQGLITWNVGGIRRMYADGTVEFSDGTRNEFDAVVLATGYKVDLPFLDEATQRVVRADDAPDHILDLYEYTFHPERARLAFVGMFIPATATLPMHDAQARWVAKVLAEPSLRTSDACMREGIEAYRGERRSERANGVVLGFEVLDKFARLGGFEVDLAVYEEWTKALIFGPLVPAQFRMFGDGAMGEEALKEFERQITAAGFHKGDNRVEHGKLRRLRVLLEELEGVGKAPKGLRAATEFLEKANARA